MQARNYELLKGNYTVKHSNVNGILISVDNTSQSWGYLRSKFEFIYFILWQIQISAQREVRGLIWCYLNESKSKCWGAFPQGCLADPSRAELAP